MDSGTYVSHWVSFFLLGLCTSTLIIRYSDDFQREKSWKRIYDGFVDGEFHLLGHDHSRLSQLMKYYQGKALVTLGTGETVNGEGRWKDILIAAHNYAIVGTCPCFTPHHNSSKLDFQDWKMMVQSKISRS